MAGDARGGGQARSPEDWPRAGTVYAIANGGPRARAVDAQGRYRAHRAAELHAR